MSESVLSEFPQNSGYSLLPKAHQNSPGYTGLVILLRQECFGSGCFEPVSLRARVKDMGMGLCQWNTLRHNNSCKAVRHVCPGQVTLVDASDSGRSFFTFGGELKCTVHENDFVYELISEAPILDLRGSIRSVPDQLAAETEAMIAEAEVKWKSDEEGFFLRLGQIDPLTLYISSIETILLNYHQNKSLMETFRTFSDALHWERGWLQNRKIWPKEVTTIDDLLGTP